MITKVWYLSDDISRDDLEALRLSGANFSIVTDDYPIDTDIFHTQNFIKSRKEIQITTSTNEEEVWLKLRYIDRVQLQTVLNTPKGDYIFTGENYDN